MKLTLKIVLAFPPNYDELKQVFPITKGTIYTYNNAIYNPYNANITPSLMAHEEIHAKQQENDPKWWDKYLIDPLFRFHQELEAHQEEFRHYKRTHNRERTAVMRNTIARRLASPLYGNICDFKTALKLIGK